MADEVVDKNTKIPETKVENTEVKVEETKEGEQKEEVVKTDEEKQQEQEVKNRQEARQSRLNRRFKDLTSNVRAAETRVTSLAEILEEVTGEAPPVRKSYANEEEYTYAMRDYRDKVRTAENNLKAAQKEHGKASEESDKALVENWPRKVAEFKKLEPDYDKIVGPSKVPMHPMTQKAILRSDVGPAIAIYLARNEDIAEDLFDLPIEEQLLEVGKLATKVQSTRKVVVETKEKIKEDPNPPPTSTVKGEKPVSKKPPGDMNLEEFTAWRKKNSG